jgi:hypothetical protein
LGRGREVGGRGGEGEGGRGRGGEGDKTKITSFLIVLFFPAGKTSSLSAVYFIHQAAVGLSKHSKQSGKICFHRHRCLKLEHQFTWFNQLNTIEEKKYKK